MKLDDYYKKELGLSSVPTFFNVFANIPSLTRLKGIDFFCGMKYASPNLDIYKFKEPISRYDHSITTALLTWKLTNDITQTLAALYHDIATPCFSHVIDYMNKDYIDQESTEEYTANIINKDYQLRSLLYYYKVNINDIIDFKKYSVVDNKRPKLCADRLDGIISTGIAWTKNLNKYNIKDIINNVSLFINEDNEYEIGFNNKEIAKLAYDTSVKINEYTHTDEDTFMMELLAKITKLAIRKNVISYDDLYYLTEDNLISKIKNSKDEKLLSLFNKFQTIQPKDIIVNNVLEIKDMNLNPLVKTKRLNI